MVKTTSKRAKDLKTGDVIVFTDRPGYDAKQQYGTVHAVEWIGEVGTRLTVTFAESWASQPIFDMTDLVNVAN